MCLAGAGKMRPESAFGVDCYLTAHSPSPYERAFYRRQLTLRGEMGKIAAYVRFN